MDVGKLLTAKNFTIVVKRLLNFITSRGVTFLEKKGEDWTEEEIVPRFFDFEFILCSAQTNANLR